MTTIHWFRQDLRLTDNPGLCAAVACGRVLPVYIHDEAGAGPYAMGSASRWWLHRSLESLSDSLDGKLAIFSGNAGDVLAELAERHRVDGVHWNRCYEPWRLQQDRDIEARLSEAGLEVRSFNGSLLWEPDDVLKADGTPYRVFSPFFYRGCRKALPPREPKTAPSSSLSLNEQRSKKLKKNVERLSSFLFPSFSCSPCHLRILFPERLRGCPRKSLRRTQH